jgi:rhodanese-related sulfurtransferase
MTSRRVWIRWGLLVALAVLGCEQIWRHGRDYVFADQFAEVEAGKIYRGAWQQPWPMRRLVHKYKFKTVLALAHPEDHPLAVREKALGREMGFRWVHIPIVDIRGTNDYRVISDELEKAAAVIADPKNQPVYFHCHHGINRASMVQIAYRTMYCGWTLKEASDEIARTFGLVEVAHGPDYRHMESFYVERVLPRRRNKLQTQARAPAVESAATASPGRF